MPTIRLDLAGALTAAEPSGRRIAGRVVPWGVVATVSNGQRVRFERGSIVAPTDPTRSPLLVDHDTTHPVGRLANFTDTPVGLDAWWAVGSSTHAADALADAADGVRSGLSIGVEPVDPDHQPDGDGVLVFTRDRPARWVETSLLSIPAYDDARVSAALAASANREGATVPATTQTADPAAPTTTDPEAAPVTAAGPPPEGTAAETPTPAATAPVATITAVRESYPYAFNGSGPSMLADYFDRDTSVAAADRLHRAAMMLADPSGLSVMAAPPEGTTDQPAIFPTIQRPDLWLSEIVRNSPLLAATTRVPITSANPFIYPITTGSTGLVTDPAPEKTNPAPGTITTTTVTLQPVLINGSYQFTRSLLDSAAPSIDVVAATAIREALSRHIETHIATALAVGADHTAHTSVVAPGTGDPSGGAAYLRGLRSALAAWWPVRYAAPTDLLAGVNDYALAIMADDATGRPLLPPGGTGSNALGSATAAAGELGFYGVGLAPAWAAPADTTYMVRSEDVSTFMSPISSFRFEEKQGPEIIELAFRLYMVAKVRRKEGVWAITHTAVTGDPEADDGGADDDDTAGTRRGRKG